MIGLHHPVVMNLRWYGQISPTNIYGIGRSGAEHTHIWRTWSRDNHTKWCWSSGGGGITINIARIDKTADFDQLKPMQFKDGY